MFAQVRAVPGTVCKPFQYLSYPRTAGVGPLPTPKLTSTISTASKAPVAPAADGLGPIWWTTCGRPARLMGAASQRQGPRSAARLRAQSKDGAKGPAAEGSFTKDLV
jgi:hypothetical protein